MDITANAELKQCNQDIKDANEARQAIIKRKSELQQEISKHKIILAEVDQEYETALEKNALGEMSGRKVEAVYTRLSSFKRQTITLNDRAKAQDNASKSLEQRLSGFVEKRDRAIKSLLREEATKKLEANKAELTRLLTECAILTTLANPMIHLFPDQLSSMLEREDYYTSESYKESRLKADAIRASLKACLPEKLKAVG